MLITGQILINGLRVRSHIGSIYLECMIIIHFPWYETFLTLLVVNFQLAIVEPDNFSQ